MRLIQDRNSVKYRSVSRKPGMTDAINPGSELGQIQIGQQEAWNDDYRRSVSRGDAETPIYGGQAQVDHLDADQHFLPDGQGNGRVGLADFGGLTGAGAAGTHWVQCTLAGTGLTAISFKRSGKVSHTAPPSANSEPA